MSKSLVQVGLPFAPERVKVGYENYERYQQDKETALAILAGQGNLIQLASQYLDSYQGTDVLTVLHYRDYLIFKALEVMLVQTQLKREDALTPHAQKVWSTITFDDIWPYRSPEDPVPQARYWGPLGTLAYLGQYCDVATPVQFIENLLSFYWGSLGLDFTEPPATRFSNLLTFIEGDRAVFTQASLQLEAFFSTLTVDNPIASLISRAGLQYQDTQPLRQRILCGEYSDTLMVVLDVALSPGLRNQIQDTIENVFSLSRPSGLIFTAQALVLEGYWIVIKALTDLEPSVALTPLAQWKQDPNHRVNHLNVAQGFCLAAEAYGIQAYWGSIEEATERCTELKELFLDWYNLSGAAPNSPALDPYRLGGTFNA